MIAAVLITPRAPVSPVAVDRPTAVCLLRLEASRLAASNDTLDLALSAALTLGADALLPERSAA